VREALEPDIQRLLVPLMTKPSHLVGRRACHDERCLPSLDTITYAMHRRFCRPRRRPSLPGAASLNQGYTVSHLNVGHTSNVVA
jgi:hypothetical protein